MKLGNRWADGAERRAGPGSAQARSGQWWEGARGVQARCACPVGGDCSQGGAAEEEGGGECEAAVVWGVAVGGWPEHEGGGFHPAWGLAHRQAVHGAAHNPGCKSTRPLQLSPLLHLRLPSGAVGDDPGGERHDESSGGRQGEGPGFEGALEKSDAGQGVCSGAPQEARAWPFGLQGST